MDVPRMAEGVERAECDTRGAAEAGADMEFGGRLATLTRVGNRLDALSAKIDALKAKWNRQFDHLAEKLDRQKRLIVVLGTILALTSLAGAFPQYAHYFGIAWPGI